MKKRLLAGILSVAVLGSLTACGGSTTSPQSNNTNTSDVKKLRLSSNVSSMELEENKTAMAKGVNCWIETLEKESNGSLQVELFPDAQLASGTEQIVSGITSGAFEVAHFATGNWSEYTNAFTELNVPYLYLNYEAVHELMDSEIGDQMMAKLEQDVQGVKALAYIDIGFRHVTNSKKEIKVPDDMKGLKIRTMNDPIQQAAMSAMGASVTTISVSELFSALQQKMVDAQENPLSTISSQKFYEVQPYCTMTRHSFTSTFMFMNASTYESLTEDQKAAVEKANEACEHGSREVVEAVEQEYKQILMDNGMEIYEPTEAELAVFREAVKTSWTEAEKVMGNDRYAALLQKMDDIEGKLGLK